MPERSMKRLSLSDMAAPKMDLSASPTLKDPYYQRQDNQQGDGIKVQGI